MNKYKRPFRVGRKQNRAVVDAEGKEVVVFKKGDEELAYIFCILFNKNSVRTLLYLLKMFKGFKKKKYY